MHRGSLGKGRLTALAAGAAVSVQLQLMARDREILHALLQVDVGKGAALQGDAVVALQADGVVGMASPVQ